tara:strand:+ start:6742 stop:7398 length:657 start_codon:yes stop_codon:yes gene_type:complete
MRNFLLSTVLIIVPVVVFAAGYAALTPATATPQAASAQAAPPLGDMSAFVAITSDVQKRASQNDLPNAQARITDLETAWDEQAKALRQANAAAWGNVDEAIDNALSAIRAKTPDPAKVDQTLTILQEKLANPSGSDGMKKNGTQVTVAGIVTTDANGRALPCEVMLDQFRTARAAAHILPANVDRVDTLEVKGTERCNADDDTRADDFFAQGIALMSN